MRTGLILLAMALMAGFTFILDEFAAVRLWLRQLLREFSPPHMRHRH